MTEQKPKKAKVTKPKAKTKAPQSQAGKTSQAKKETKAPAKKAAKPKKLKTIPPSPVETRSPEASPPPVTILEKKPKKAAVAPAARSVVAPARPSAPAKPAVHTAPPPAAAPVAPEIEAPAPVAAQAVSAPPPPPPAPPKPRIKIKINEVVAVKDLAEKLQIKVNDLIRKLMQSGVLATINQRIASDVATLAADAFGADVEVVPLFGSEVGEISEKEDTAALKPRPPVVTVMGHVDHGKTSLLDAIRKTTVAAKEAGGMTQHIGAYKISTEKGDVVFLDTPGHEAFTAMRARGAQVTDIVILVVAADDGLMPQTVEAIDHAKAANVPIVVAINKTDLPTANVQRLKQQLSQYNLVSEDWGGQTIMVEVSAKTNKNLDQLLELLLLQAELLELKANPDRPAQGIVIEARLDSKKGVAATVLVQKGTLRVGDAFVCGYTFGKVRALQNDHGHRVKDAPPATPVEIMGFEATPHVGDRFAVVTSEHEAREISERRTDITREESARGHRHMTLEELHQRVSKGVKDLKVILKGDVQGSLEAVRDSLDKISSAQIKLQIIHSGTGGINESDVILAAASDAVIIGFNVRPELNAENLAKKEGVDIRTYRIIFELLADIRAAMEGLLEPEFKDVTLGRAEVREVFRLPKIGNIAGCFVTDGKAVRGAKVRLLRNSVIIFEGSLSSLKRFKDDAREVEKGFECGMGLEGYQDLKKGDALEFYTQEKQARKLQNS